MIRDENASLVGYVYVDIDPTLIDIGTYVQNAKDHLASKINFSRRLSYHLERPV